MAALAALLIAPASAYADAPVHAEALISPIGSAVFTSASAEAAAASSPSALPARVLSGRATTTSVAPTGTSTTCTPSWGAFRVGNWPPGCWKPYGKASPFNVPIPASPRISSESAAIVKYMTGHGWRFEHNREGDFTWDVGGSRPVYWPTSTDPVVTVTCRYKSCPGIAPRIPAGALPEEGSGHMTVVEQARGLEYDFWQATAPANGSMTVSAESAIPIGAETGTGLEGRAEAADLGLLGGIVRAAELSAGKIEHALVTTVKCVQLKDVWPSPATGKGDAICPEGGLGPHFASLLQLNMSDAEIAATGAPGWQQTIMKAMAHYGVYVVDTDNERKMYLLAENDFSFTSFGYVGQMSEFVNSHGAVNGVLTGVPIKTGKLRVIDPCVPQRTC